MTKTPDEIAVVIRRHAEYEDGTRSRETDPLLSHLSVINAARVFLAKIDNMTTYEFERGGERIEREALRTALAVYDR